MDLVTTTSKVQEMASENAALGSSIKFKFSEGVIHLDGTGDANVVTNNDDSSACTISISLENFNKLMNGDLNPMTAFMMGKLKVDGDMGVAMKLTSLF